MMFQKYKELPLSVTAMNRYNGIEEFNQTGSEYGKWEDDTMRLYTDETKKECKGVVCNRCGKSISVRNNILQEDVLKIEKTWGYFSSQDGKNQIWDLCEECYELLISDFLIPVEEREITEYL